MQFVRFQSPFTSHRGIRLGVLALANSLAHQGNLSDDKLRNWRTNNDWFNAAYAHPPAKIYDASIHPRATAWFKDTATHLIERVDWYLKLLETHRVPCVETWSGNPGEIVYEDEVQVVVLPR